MTGGSVSDDHGHRSAADPPEEHTLTIRPTSMRPPAATNTLSAASGSVMSTGRRHRTVLEGMVAAPGCLSEIARASAVQASQLASQARAKAPS
jgi:hypothetical protein